jgi:SAM-dependent methyltransferase
MWNDIGVLQFNFLVQRGLQPHHRLIDVGCGSLRGGVRFARYLEKGNYFGIDLNQSLIDAGYEKELKPEGLEQRVPRSNLYATHDFDVSVFGKRFDYALALSVFTHLPLNSIRICLERLGPHMATGGAFYATVFEAKPEKPTWQSCLHQPGGIVTHGDRDPYHYRREDMAYIAGMSGWSAEWIGQFDHPRDQQMICFRLTQ